MNKMKITSNHQKLKKQNLLKFYFLKPIKR